MKRCSFLRGGKRRQSGQGIVEYASVLAFVSVMVAILLAFPGPLSLAIGEAYASVTGQINVLANR